MSRSIRGFEPAAEMAPMPVMTTESFNARSCGRKTSDVYRFIGCWAVVISRVRGIDGADMNTTETMICKALQARLEKRIAAVVDLEGESETVDVSAGYEVGDDALNIVGVDASRPWVKGVLSLVLEAKGAQVPLPGGVQGAMIKMVF